MALPYPKSNLDGMRALSYGFDDTTQTFRTTAAFSGTISVDLDPTTDGVFMMVILAAHELLYNL